MQQWDPGQSQSVSNLMVPDWGTSTFVQRWDRSRAAVRTEWVRPRAGGGTRNYTEILNDTGGYVIGNDANGAQPARAVQTQGNNPQPMKTMSSLRSRALLRELERDDMVYFMIDRPARVFEFPSQTVGRQDIPRRPIPRRSRHLYRNVRSPDATSRDRQNARFRSIHGRRQFRRDLHRLARRQWNQVSVPHHLHAEWAEGVRNHDHRAER